MREIMFRGWHKKHKIMRILGILNFLDSSFLPDYSFAQGWEQEDVILMQFTGLKDKNGKEIYEGDLLKEIDQFGRIYEAVWYDNGWSLTIEPYHNRHFKDAFTMEVIGNIYENPDLVDERA